MRSPIVAFSLFAAVSPAIVAAAASPLPSIPDEVPLGLSRRDSPMPAFPIDMPVAGGLTKNAQANQNQGLFGASAIDDQHAQDTALNDAAPAEAHHSTATMPEFMKRPDAPLPEYNTGANTPGAVAMARAAGAGSSGQETDGVPKMPQ